MADIKCTEWTCPFYFKDTDGREICTNVTWDSDNPIGCGGTAR